MKIRHWPITIVGGTLLFATLSCTEPADPADGDDTTAGTDTTAQDVGSQGGGDTDQPPVDVGGNKDLVAPEDTAEGGDDIAIADTQWDTGNWGDGEGSEASEDTEDGWSHGEDTGDTWSMDGAVADVHGRTDTNGNDDVEWVEDTGESPEDVATPMDTPGPTDAIVIAEDTNDNDGPKAGDPCEHGVFDPAGVICSETLPPEVLLICDGEKYLDPKDPENAGQVGMCDCWETPTGEIEASCATPGFVGIARAKKRRVITQRLRRV